MRRARHRGGPAISFRQRLKAFGRSGGGALAVAGAVLALGLVGAVFSSTSQNPGNVYTADQLNSYVPTAATATRTSATTCLVSWTPVASPPSGTTYDVTDGSGTTVATGVSGTSQSITVPATAVTPTVKARLGSWVSSSARATTAACNGYPDAPALTLVPSDGAVSASWTAPAGNGGTVASYTATISPAPGSGSATCTTTAPSTSCAWSSLTNGLTYTVSVTATSNVGTGPAGTATTVPYPSTVMTSSAVRLWLDGADSSTVLASSGCTGPAATTTVGCWKDKSTSANHATQATGGNRPGLATVASRSVPSFDGSTSYFGLTPTLLPNGTASSTTFAAIQMTDATPASSSFRTVVSWGAGATGQTRSYQKMSGSAAVGPLTWSGSASTGGSLTTGTTAVLSDAWTATGYTGYFNGVAGTTAAWSGTTGTTAATVGAQINATGFWKGPIPEIIVLSGTVTAADRHTVEEYLSRKWSVTITPGQPTAVAAAAGDAQTTVSWTAPYDGGSSITSYTVTATPSDGTLSTVTLSCASSPCTLTGLTNGATYTVTVTANNAVGAGPASSSVTVIPRPALLASSNAVLWLDGTDVDGDGVLEGTGESCDTATSCTSTSNVLKRWVDKTGGGRDAVQSTTAMAGTWTPATGLVSFSGNGYYQTAAGVPTGPGITAFAVASSATSTFNTWGWLVGTRAANGWIMHPNQSGTNVDFFGMTSAGFNLHTTHSPYVLPGTALTNPHVWDGQITGGTSSQTLDAAVDGNVSSTASSTSTRAAANVVLTIGADDYDLAARRGQGAFREIVVFKTALTAAERVTIRQYLARKWGAPVVPDAPSGVTATPSSTTSGTAAVSWTAPSNGGSAITGYTVTATSSDATAAAVSQSCASSPCTVSGFTDGATYTVTVTATNAVGTGAASSGASLITYPASVLTSARLAFWLDGADASTLFTDVAASTPATTVGQSVARWNDKSGRTDGSGINDARQTTSGSRPVLQTVNGRPVPWFDGTQLLTLRTQASLATGNAPSTEFAVATRAGIAGPWRDVWEYGTGCPNGMRGIYATLGGTPTVWVDACSSPNTEDTGVLWGSSPTVVSAVFNGGITSSANGRPALSTSAFTLNTNAAGAQVGSQWIGGVAEVISLNVALSTSERRTVDEYLARKWGTVITPAAPTGVTATPSTTTSQTASVSWTAPSWNGGAAVSGYTVTGTPSDPTAATVTQSCASSPCTVTGFTDGAAYTVTVAAVNSVGTGASSSGVSLTTYPASVMTTSATQLWMDGADSSTLFTSTSCSGATASSGAIGCWKDKSSQANNASQTTSTMQPTVGSLNGRTAPLFDGVDDYYPLAVAKLPTGTTPSTVWAVAAQEDTAPASSSWRHAIGWGAAGTGLGRVLEKGSGSSLLYLETYDSWAYVSPTKTWPVGSAVVTDGVITSTTFSSNMNGAVNYSGTATNNTGTSAGAALGATGWSTGQTWKGRIAEMVVTNTAATSAQTRVVQEYLARKWGVTITPAAPTSVSATPGTSSATVSWSAPAWNGGSSVTSYTVTASGSGSGNGTTCTSATTSCTFSSLAPGTYTFTVTATNAVGTGPASSASGSVTVTASFYVWGDGTSGRTGVILQNSTTSTPARMPGTEQWAVVDGGTDNACGVTTSGALYCWGGNTWGALGLGDSNQRWEPVRVASGSTWSTVDIGQDTTCGLKTDQTAWCWGYGGNGEIGDGTTNQRTVPTAVVTTGVQTWSRISEGSSHACGIKTDGTLWCWGNGGSGRLGNGSTSDRTTPVQVNAGTTYSAVSSGWDHTCAIRASDSAMQCWGNGGNGQLGNGATASSSTPVTVSGGLTWSVVAAADNSTCGVTTGGALYCWGHNGYGQLGDGTVTDRSTPTREATASTSWATAPLTGSSTQAAVLRSWDHHTCALRTTGTMWCWGYNGSGQLGDGTVTQRTSPVQVGSLTTWRSAGMGQSTTCLLSSDASLWCAGTDGNGQLGQYYGNSAGSPTPVLAPGTTFSAGATGYAEGCGVKSDGTLWCWGGNANGVVGDGTVTQRWSPVQAGAATTWRSVSIGSVTACGTRTDDSLWCWGYAGYGQTGISGASGNVTSPTAGPAGSWSSVSVGDTHTCGIKTDGTLWCWGENLNGGIGDGTTTNRSTPVAITATGVTTWASVSAGFYNTCGIAATGTYAGNLFCWGYNANGQLGDGTTTNRNSPTRIGTATWTSISAGRLHTCGIQTAGTFWCWGYNGSGQVGDGTVTQRTTPTQVGSATTWAEAAAGYEHTCGRRTDSTLWCWGINGNRQLGNRDTTNLSTPNQVPGVTVSDLGDTHGAARMTVAFS